MVPRNLVKKSNNAGLALFNKAPELKAVIKVGGFAFLGEATRPLVEEYVKLLGSLATDNRIVVVTGGGKIARLYISAARGMGVPESMCDQLGILVTRLNARLLVDGLGELAFPEIPTNIDELKHCFTSKKIVAMGGLQPAHSTNAVAAIAAETIKADIFVNATNVDGVHSADPTKDPKAKKYKQISVQQLAELLSKDEMIAGTYDLMDSTALKVIARSKIPTVIIDGRDTQNVVRALKMEDVGTKIDHQRDST